MPVKLLSERMDATITDEDKDRIETILSFWFKEQELSAPQIDRRMDVWFGEDQVFDHEVEKEFAADVENASEGKLDHWAHKPHGRLALILLLDQFRRNVWVAPYPEDDLDSLVALIGADRVLNGSDFPHPEGLANPSDFVDRIETLAESDVRTIMRNNGLSLLKGNS